ncbi:MAG: RagB/SusD family nutrient uptake outer membrane protein [Paludibacteraceae bacterium]|nr:RagB/SusD family nutrient uptake outer membrane protein [Paludibacteraceae bacterium]
MKKSIIYILGIIILLSGCTFLDKEPDLRADINSRKKIQLLLVSGYAMPNIAALGETMSDNAVDNNSPDRSGKCQNLEPIDQMYTQYFTFADITASTNVDSPFWIWQCCYQNIAVANHALKAIDQVESQTGEKLNAERAEALMIRAYNHFILVNVFCKAYRDENLSKQDVGIHYMKDVETTVRPQYDRSTVAEVYKNIEADLVAALETYGVDDGYYSVPKYHFNKSAAYAFAARFYLFIRKYDKVIEYANLVLGSDPLALMWDAKTAKEYGNADNERDAWFDASSPANLMLTTTYSVFSRAFWPTYARYVLNREALDLTINGDGPNWSGRFPGFNTWHYDQTYGAWLTKREEYFEYTDKVAGIGHPCMLRREFTTGETLLCRAEAEIMTGQMDAAIADMNIWTKGYLCKEDLIGRYIEDFFSLDKNEQAREEEGEKERIYERYFQIVPTLHCTDMSPLWTEYTENKLPYIWCVLHFRRIENLHDGTRFYDIKRYGIEITHYFGPEKNKYFLSWNDDRKAVQLPQEVIIAGQPKNERINTGDNNSAIVSGIQTNVDDFYRPNVTYTATISRP